MAAADHRAELRRLIQGAGITQTQAAQLMARQSGRPVSARAIRSWLANSSLPSARSCPDWAVHLLEAALKKRGKKHD